MIFKNLINFELLEFTIIIQIQGMWLVTVAFRDIIVLTAAWPSCGVADDLIRI